MRVGSLACIGVALGACGGDYVQTDPRSTGNPECPGCAWVTRDNPVLQGDALLEAASVSGEAWDEQAERAACGGDVLGSCWRFDRVELFVSTRGGASPSSEGGELEPWPAAPGTFDPGTSSTGLVNLPWEAHGARVGYQDLTIDAYRADARAARTDMDLDTRLRLDAETILVPVQVVQAVPESGGLVSTAWADARGADFIFDDTWHASVARSSAGGVLIGLSGRWDNPPQHQTPPDELYEQCGIQFRVVRHVEVPVRDEIWKLEAPGDVPRAHCYQAPWGIGPEAYGYYRTGQADNLVMEISGLAQDVDRGLPVVTVTSILNHWACRDLPEFEVQGFTSGNLVFLHASAEPRTIAHELGHVLHPGAMLDYASTSDLRCTSGDDATDDLMCAHADGTHISTCAEMRLRAATFSNRYYGTSFPE